MPLLWAVLLGLLAGYFRRGRLSHLAALRLHGFWLLLPPLLIQILIFPLGGRGPILSFGTPYWHIVSYLFLLAFVFLNRGYPEILLMGLGLFLNFLAIVANGGYMPASAEALRKAGLESVAQGLAEGTRSGNTVLMGPKTHLNFLGDWLYLPAWFPLSSAFSVGDVILGFGAALLLARRMVHP
ncbi:MAG: DUF5317 domain-containing protein [Candidatus Bipolaricaulaceae bacterium]